MLAGASAETARAQYVPYGPFDAYPNSQLREGPGFKVLGDGLVIHPGIATELGYDSNMLMPARRAARGCCGCARMWIWRHGLRSGWMSTRASF